MLHHLPETVNIPSSHESLSCFSLSEDASNLIVTLEKDKRELEEELLWLRETSKTALQESWNEVEDLRCQCADYVKVETRLLSELSKSRAGENAWRIRCHNAEKRQTMPIEQENSRGDSHIRPLFGSLGEINETCSPTVSNSMPHLSRKNTLLSFRDKMRSWSGGNLRCMDEQAKRPLSTPMNKVPCSSQNMSLTPSVRPRASDRLVDRDEVYFRAAEANMNQILNSTIPCQTAAETKPNQFYLYGNATSEKDLSLVISSRDKIITSLEQTLSQQLSDIQSMEHEMFCLTKTQRKNKKRIHVPLKQKEESLHELVLSLQGQIETNGMHSKKQDKKMQKLTDELEKVLKFVKRAEED